MEKTTKPTRAKDNALPKVYAPDPTTREFITRMGQASPEGSFSSWACKVLQREANKVYRTLSSREQ